MSDTNTHKKFFLAKYALNRGIKEVFYDGEVSERGYIHPQGTWTSYKVGRDVFEERGNAVAAAESMRLKKIDALKKQLAKLEKMKFA